MSNVQRYEGPLHRALVAAVATLFLAGLVGLGQDMTVVKAAPSGTTMDSTTGPSSTVVGATVDDTAVPLTDASAAPAGTPSSQRTATSSAGNGKGAAPADNRKLDQATGPPVQLGLAWLDTAQANGAVTAVSGGAIGAFQGDQKIQAQALVDYMNAHGGLAGRKIEPVFWQLDLSNQLTKSGRQQEAQKMCATFTEDNHVFAMLSGGVSLPEHLIVDCAARTKTPLIMGKTDGMLYLSESKLAQVADYYYWPSGLSAERRERAVVAGLRRQGFLKPSSRVGLLIQDDPYIKEGVEKGLKPALAAAGINVAAQAVYPDFIESPWQSYVLQMQTANVDFVYFASTTGSAFPALLFMRSADSQHFEPQYGLGGDNSACGLVTLNAPEAQVKNAHAVGWNVGQDTCETPIVSPHDATCRAIWAKIGQPEYGNANSYCEGMFLLSDALGGSTVSVANLAKGVNALGKGQQSVWTYETFFAPDRHAAVGVVRDSNYRADCRCFRYTSPPEPVQ
jgi:hypothetical protein